MLIDGLRSWRTGSSRLPLGLYRRRRKFGRSQCFQLSYCHQLETRGSFQNLRKAMRTIRHVVPLANPRAVQFPDARGIEDRGVDMHAAVIKLGGERFQRALDQRRFVGEIDAVEEMSAVAGVAIDGIRPALLSEK